MILVQIWCNTLCDDTHDIHEIARKHTIIKRSKSTSSLVSERVQIALRAFCVQQNRVRSTTSQEVWLVRSIITLFTISNGTLKTRRDNFDLWSNTKNARFFYRAFFYYLLENNELPCGHELAYAMNCTLGA